MKSKIFKNQKKEIKNFSKLKKRNQKFKKKPKKIQIDFITHLKNYVCIEIILMFLYSFVHKILIVNFELCAVIILYNSFDNFNSFYVSVSSIPNHSYNMFPYPQQLGCRAISFLLSTLTTGS